jgi:plastocyanin
MNLCVASVYAQDAEYEEYEVTDGGRIAGRVLFESDFPGAQTQKTTADVDVCGVRVPDEKFVVDPETKGLANVVVRLVGVEEGKPFAAAKSELAQLECRYTPHIAVVRAGEKLRIVNQDPILHNIHAYRGDNTVFNLAQPRQGQVTPKKMSDAGVVRVACDIHEWMEGWVIVVDKPYVAITDAQGQFELADVPPGDYTLTLWQRSPGDGLEAGAGHDRGGERGRIPDWWVKRMQRMMGNQ